MSQSRGPSSEPEKQRGFFLLFSLILTAVIAAGLPRLVFQPGLPLPSFENGQVVLQSQDENPVGMGLGSFSAVLFFIMLGVCLLALLIQALRGVQWKQLLKGIGSLMVKLALVAGVVLIVVMLLPRSSGTAEAAPMPTPRPLETAPLGPVPSAVLWAAAIALGAALVALSLRLLLVRRRDEPRPWEREVVRARGELLDGCALRDVIIRCYTNMAAALQEERGIERETSMTAGEFELILADKGIPWAPVHELTRLFEAARYSIREPMSSEERRAIACLDEILQHSRQAVPAGDAT